MVSPCTKKMREQVQEELTAAMTYFAMVIRNYFIIFDCLLVYTHQKTYCVQSVREINIFCNWK